MKEIIGNTIKFWKQLLIGWKKMRATTVKSIANDGVGGSFLVKRKKEIFIYFLIYYSGREIKLGPNNARGFKFQM